MIIYTSIVYGLSQSLRPAAISIVIKKVLVGILVYAGDIIQ